MNKLEFLTQTKTNWTVSKRPLFDQNTIPQVDMVSTEMIQTTVLD